MEKPSDAADNSQAVAADLGSFVNLWDTMTGPRAGLSDIADRRAANEAVTDAVCLPIPPDVLSGTEKWINTATGPVRLRIFRHRSTGLQPGMIYFPGGAFVMGSPESQRDIAALIASRCRMSVLSVDYAKAPESPFPTAFFQCREVVQAVWARASSFGIDRSRLLIGGDSAGGNLAAAVTIDLLPEVSLLGQLLIYPVCDFDFTRPSCTENAAGPVLRLEDLDRMARIYCPDASTRQSDRRVSPLVAAGLTGLSPCFIATAQYDPLRDSGLAFAASLRAAGVKVTEHRGSGLVHGYIRALRDSATARAAAFAMTDWITARCR